MFRRYNLKFESGVTLLELLVVMGVIATLAGAVIMFINPKGQIGKANDARRKSDLAQLQRALETYYQDYGGYPGSAGNIVDGRAWGTSWSTYMSRLPIDPTSARRYIYFSTGQYYYLYAYLEAPRDPQMCKPTTGAACDSAVLNGLGNSCGGTCNYGVTSSNTTP